MMSLNCNQIAISFLTLLTVASSAPAIAFGSGLEVTGQDGIEVTVKDERGFGVASKIRLLRFRSDDMCEGDRYIQVGSVDSDGGPSRLREGCDENDWLAACPLGSVYRRTQASEPKRCRGPEVSFVFGFTQFETVFFDFDSEAVRADQKQVMHEMAGLLERDPDLNVSVSGYADPTGPTGYNQELSLRRAESVKSYLIELGVPEDQINVYAFGEGDPLAPTGHDSTSIPLKRRVLLELELDQ